MLRSFLECERVCCLGLAVQSKIDITALPELAKLMGKGKLGDNTTFDFMLNRPGSNFSLIHRIVGSDTQNIGSQSVRHLSEVVNFRTWHHSKYCSLQLAGREHQAPKIL